MTKVENRSRRLSFSQNRFQTVDSIRSQILYHSITKICRRYSVKWFGYRPYRLWWHWLEWQSWYSDTFFVGRGHPEKKDRHIQKIPQIELQLLMVTLFWYPSNVTVTDRACILLRCLVPLSGFDSAQFPKVISSLLEALVLFHGGSTIMAFRFAFCRRRLRVKWSWGWNTSLEILLYIVTWYNFTKIFCPNTFLGQLCSIIISLICF